MRSGAVLVLAGLWLIFRTVSHDDAGQNLVDRIMSLGGGSSSTSSGAAGAVHPGSGRKGPTSAGAGARNTGRTGSGAPATGNAPVGHSMGRRAF